MHAGGCEEGPLAPGAALAPPGHAGAGLRGAAPTGLAVRAHLLSPPLLLLPATRLNSNRTQAIRSLLQTTFALTNLRVLFVFSAAILACESSPSSLSSPLPQRGVRRGRPPMGCPSRAYRHRNRSRGLGLGRAASQRCVSTARDLRGVFCCRDLMTVKTLSQQSFGCVCRRRVARFLHPISEGTIARTGTVLAWSTRTDQARETPWGGGTPVGKTAWHRERHVVTDICV